MANELSATARLSFSKSNASLNVSVSAIRTISGSTYTDTIQTIGTSAEAIVFGDIGTPGYYMLQNLDATNYVEISHDAGATYSHKLFAGSATAPGDFMITRNNGGAVHARANTAAINLSIRAVAP
jgi:hypothetical protein